MTTTKRPFENIVVGNGEIADNQHFSPFPSVFFSIKDNSNAFNSVDSKILLFHGNIAEIDNKIVATIFFFNESNSTGSSVFFMGVSLGKTLQSPSLVLVKPKKDMNNVSCCSDMTEILVKVV